MITIAHQIDIHVLSCRFHDVAFLSSTFGKDLCALLIEGEGGGDSFDCYAVKTVTSLTTLSAGGTSWDGAWVLADSPFGSPQVETFDTYTVGDADDQVLNGGEGFSGAWVVNPSPALDDGTYPPLAFGFAGTAGNRISGGTATTNPTEYTIAGWFRRVGDATILPTLQNLVGRSNGAPLSNWSHAIECSTVFRAYTFDGGAKLVTGTTVITAGTWYHVAATCKNSNFQRLYVNGVEEGTATAIGSLWTGGNDWWIASAAYLRAAFYGNMADVAIWSKQLTASEIAQLATATEIGEPLNVQSASLIAHFLMQDEDHGASVSSDWIESVTGLTQTRTGTPVMVGGPDNLEVPASP